MIRILRRTAGLALLGRGTSRPLWYALDVLLAASLLALDLPRVWTTYPGDYVVGWQPSALAVTLVVLQTVPIAVRRLAPLPVLAIALAAVMAYGQLDGQPEPDYLSVCVAVYTVAADVPPRVSRWCCGAAALLLPVALAQDLTLLGIFRAWLLIVLVWVLGLERRRAILDRVRAAGQRIQQEARERGIRAAQQHLQRRENIARSLHDGLGRSLTLMTIHGEALKAEAGTISMERIDALLRSSREALTAVQGAVAALDRGSLPDEPTSWERLLADFRDSGLVVDVDHGPGLLALDDISLDDATGRCLYRVVHEGLTNALRHAGPGNAVRIRAIEDSAGRTVEVVSEGGDDRPARTSGGGFGLTSLGQDVQVLSGDLEYGPTDSGWRLSAWLPRIPSGGGATPAAGPIPVVVVDDEAMVRQGLCLLLGRHPDLHVVAELSDGGELLTFLGLGDTRTDRPIRRRYPRRLVILLDLLMPHVDGFAVLAALGRLPQPDRPLVLILTGYGGDASVRRALDMGAHGFLLKGGTADQLAHGVRAVAGGLTALSSDVTRRHRPLPSDDTARRLTPRELEVLDLLGEGLSNRAIARRLGVSERTVKIHVSAVLAKLGVESRTQAALQVRRR